MIQDSIIPDWYIPSGQCLEWLRAESFKFWRLSDKAAEAHNWGLCDTLMAMSDLAWNAYNEVWNTLVRDTKEHLTICSKILEHRKKVKSREV